jgi:hypothetical protein
MTSLRVVIEQILEIPPGLSLVSILLALLFSLLRSGGYVVMGVHGQNRGHLVMDRQCDQFFSATANK